MKIHEIHEKSNMHYYHQENDHRTRYGTAIRVIWVARHHIPRIRPIPQRGAIGFPLILFDIPRKILQKIIEFS